MKQRADDLALGRVTNPNIAFQLDTGGAYEALPGKRSAQAHIANLERELEAVCTAVGERA